jgi:twitching motility protein PilU
MYKDGLVSKEEALGNADSATNLMWLMNQDGNLGAAPAPGAEKTPEQPPSMENTGSFSEFKLLVDEPAAQ